MTAARSWTELSATEAEALLTEYRAQLGPASDAFVRRVDAAGQGVALAAGVDRLDDLVWPIVRAIDARPVDVEVLLGDDRTPLWAQHTFGVAATIGVAAAVFVAELAAHCTTLVSASAGSLEWDLDRDSSSADHNRPTMIVDGRRSPYFDDQLGVLVAQFVRGDTVAAEPGRIAAVVRSRLPVVPDPASSVADDPTRPPVSVAAEAPGQAWTHVIEVDDVVAHEREQDVADLVRRLRNHQDVSMVIHSDREIVLVATTLSTEALSEVVLGIFDDGR